MAETTRKKRVVKKSKSASLLSNLTNPIRTRVLNLKERLQKIPRKQLYLWLGVLVIISLLIYFKNLFVVAWVNGQPITRLTLVQQLEAQSGRKVLDDLVTEALVLQEGRKQNIVVPPQDVEEEFKKIEESVISSGEDFDAALSSRQLTREGLKTNIRLNKTLTKLVEKNLQVSDQEIKDYLEKNKESLPKDKSEEELKKLAQESLKEDKEEQLKQDLLAKLRKDAKINYWRSY